MKLLLIAAMLAALAPPGQAQPARAARQIEDAQRRADAQIERLLRMSPRERERVLARIAPARRTRIEARLAELEAMPPDERARLGRRLQSFRDLPAQDRDRLRELAQRLNDTEPPRRGVLTRELRLLRSLDDDTRQRRLDSPRFRRQFSSSERELLEQLSSAALPEE